jgi:hypothetical protein
VDRVARAGPVAPEDPVAPVVRVGPAAQDRADLAARVTLVDPADMNRVVAATVGTAPAAVMAPADLASRAVPVVRVGMILVDPAVPVGMIPVGMILGDPEGRLRAPNPVVQVDPERLVVPNPVVRVDPENREATDPSLGRALLGRMPMRLHLTVVRPLLMPALLQPTPADRRRDLTARAVATCQEATRAQATRAVAIRRAGATDGGAELSWRTDRKPVCLLTNVAYANL